MVCDARTAHQCFREITAHTVGQNCHLSAYVDTGFERRFLLAVFAHSTITRPNAHDAFPLHEELGASEDGEHVDPLCLSQPRHPLAQLLEGDDEMSVIVEWWRRERKCDFTVPREEEHPIFRDLR